ncbi:MAG: PDZ domain-containing protein [Balneola sp.]|nr:PDZ domain-containing protein [Balneola sp.]
MKYLTIILPILLFSGCAPNPFSKFYYDQTGGVDITEIPTIELSEDTPQVYRGNNVENDIQVMLERGYTMVGYSSFNSGNAKMRQAISQGKSVHAETIVMYSQYTNTASGAIPLTLPETETTTTNTSGSVYGSGGYGTYSGTETTTTYGSSTTYIPYNVNRYDYLATYWVKIKPPIFGVHYRDLNTSERQALETNKGIVITAVVNNSPAFLSDILKGDILKQFGSVEIINSESFQKAIQQYKGDTIQIEFLRKGQSRKASVTLRDGQ